MVKIKDITGYLESHAPLAYQESYDNSGLIVGSPEEPVKNVLVSLDCTPPVVDEALETECNLIICHHPIWFNSLKKLSGNSYVERSLIKAIKNDIAIYAAHTNLDNYHLGVNKILADKLGITKPAILNPVNNKLLKLVTFCPKSHTESILEALHEAGAGSVGEYDNCSYTSSGTGRFRPSENADPYLGKSGVVEQVDEDRLELILPAPLERSIINALIKAHPYEEVAYYISQLSNVNQQIGAGMVGDLPNPMSAEDFLAQLKKVVGTPCIKHTADPKRNIEKVAVCGGAGSFLIKHALAAHCDAFITSDLKYHEYFDAEGTMLLADIGHYESEVFTKELLSDLLTKNFSTFAVRLSQIESNPIRYFI